MWLLDSALYERNQALIDFICDMMIVLAIAAWTVTLVEEHFSRKTHIWVQIKTLSYGTAGLFNMGFAATFYGIFAVLVIGYISWICYYAAQEAIKMCYKDELQGIYLGARKRREKQKHDFILLTPEQQEEYRRHIPSVETMRIKWYIYFPAVILPSVPIMIVMPLILK